jgi:hypothetical protein
MVEIFCSRAAQEKLCTGASRERAILLYGTADAVATEPLCGSRPPGDDQGRGLRTPRPLSRYRPQ